jgi:hypothetical protein
MPKSPTSYCFPDVLTLSYLTIESCSAREDIWHFLITVETVTITSMQGREFRCVFQ